MMSCQGPKTFCSHSRNAGGVFGVQPRLAELGEGTRRERVEPTVVASAIRGAQATPARPLLRPVGPGLTPVPSAGGIASARGYPVGSAEICSLMA
jgi:hypothetical protein